MVALWLPTLSLGKTRRCEESMGISISGKPESRQREFLILRKTPKYRINVPSGRCIEMLLLSIINVWLATEYGRWEGL